MDSVTDIVFFIVCKICFLWFYRKVGFERELNCRGLLLKRVQRLGGELNIF